MPYEKGFRLLHHLSEVIGREGFATFVRAYIAERIGECTGRSMEETIVDFQRDRYFTPETALDYGIIDRVVQPNKAYNEEYMAEVAKKKAAQVAARAEAAKKKQQEQEQAPPSSGETPPPAPA